MSPHSPQGKEKPSGLGWAGDTYRAIEINRTEYYLDMPNSSIVEAMRIEFENTPLTTTMHWNGEEFVEHETGSVTHDVYSKGASTKQKLAAISKLPPPPNGAVRPTGLSRMNKAHAMVGSFFLLVVGECQ